MNELRVRGLGFAAYVLMQDNVRVDGYDGATREYVMSSDSELDLNVLRKRYINSCCRTHDSNVLQLKQLITGG